MTGIARKNVNSVAIALDTPRKRAPTIVAPDLDVPGIIASIWKTPIRSTVWMDQLGQLYNLRFSCLVLVILNHDKENTI